MSSGRALASVHCPLSLTRTTSRLCWRKPRDTNGKFSLYPAIGLINQCFLEERHSGLLSLLASQKVSWHGGSIPRPGSSRLSGPRLGVLGLREVQLHPKEQRDTRPPPPGPSCPQSFTKSIKHHHLGPGFCLMRAQRGRAHDKGVYWKHFFSTRVTMSVELFF